MCHPQFRLGVLFLCSSLNLAGGLDCSNLAPVYTSSIPNWLKSDYNNLVQTGDRIVKRRFCEGENGGDNGQRAVLTQSQTCTGHDEENLMPKAVKAIIDTDGKVRVFRSRST